MTQRGSLIYFAILSAVLGALLVCLVVAGAFLEALLEVKLAEGVAGLFILAMVTMVVSWSLLLRGSLSSHSHRHPPASLITPEPGGSAAQ